MALQTLRYRANEGRSFTETKDGLIPFSGKPMDLHPWWFRITTRRYAIHVEAVTTANREMAKKSGGKGGAKGRGKGQRTNASSPSSFENVAETTEEPGTQEGEPDDAQGAEEDGDDHRSEAPTQYTDHSVELAAETLEPTNPSPAWIRYRDSEILAREAVLMSNILMNLRGEAQTVAQDLDMNILMGKNGIDYLRKELYEHVFPEMDDEGKELYSAGAQTGTGHILARQRGENMRSYIKRRERWYKTISSIASHYTFSSRHLGDLLLDNAGLTKIEKN